MEEILHLLRLVVYAIIYRVLNIPGGCLGFLPSTVAGCLPVRYALIFLRLLGTNLEQYDEELENYPCVTESSNPQNMEFAEKLLQQNKICVMCNSFMKYI